MINMRYAAVIFDLDGTLLDTLQDLADSGNYTLAAHGFPMHDADAYRYFVGDGVSRLFERSLPEEARQPDVIARCAATFREAYGQRWNVKTRPYPGIPELLQWLAVQQIPAAVLSNKPDDFTRRCVQELLADFRFAAVLGQKAGLPLKPDPTGAREICAQLGLDPARTVYLGDTSVDMQTANAARMFPVGALWGFRTADEMLAGGARVLIQHPAELVGLIEGSP